MISFSSASLWSHIPNGRPWASWTIPCALVLSSVKQRGMFLLFPIRLAGRMKWQESCPCNACGVIHKALRTLISNWREEAGVSMSFKNWPGSVFGDEWGPTVTTAVSRGCRGWVSLEPRLGPGRWSGRVHRIKDLQAARGAWAVPAGLPALFPLGLSLLISTLASNWKYCVCKCAFDW